MENLEEVVIRHDEQIKDLKKVVPDLQEKYNTQNVTNEKILNSLDNLEERMDMFLSRLDSFEKAQKKNDDDGKVSVVSIITEVIKKYIVLGIGAAIGFFLKQK